VISELQLLVNSNRTGKPSISMETLTIDLKKNPDIADLVKTMQPGDPVDLHTSIKAADDQTLTLTVRSASEGKPFPAEEVDEEEAEEESPAPGESMDGSQAGAGPDAMGMTGGEPSAT
jgi:hypothetical protein